MTIQVKEISRMYEARLSDIALILTDSEADRADWRFQETLKERIEAELETMYSFEARVDGEDSVRFVQHINDDIEILSSEQMLEELIAELRSEINSGEEK